MTEVEAAGRIWPAPAFDVVNVWFAEVYDPTIHLVIEVDGHLDRAALRAALGDTVLAAPVLRCRYVERHDRGYWEELPLSSVDMAFSFSEEPFAPDEGTYALPVIDAFAGPQIRLSLFRDRRAHADTLVLSIHHAAVDANGLFQTAVLLAECYRERVEGREPDIHPLWEERGTEGIRAGFTDEECARAYADESAFAESWGFPCQSLSRSMPRWARLDIPAERFIVLRKYARERGATLNDLLLAAYFAALLDATANEDLYGMDLGLLGTLDLRRYLRCIPPRSICNLSVGYELRLSAEKQDGLEDILSRVAHIMQEKKASHVGLGTVVFYEKTYLAGISEGVAPLFAAMRETYAGEWLKNPILTNTGVIPSAVASYFRGEEGGPVTVRHVWCPAPATYPPGSILLASTFEGHMTLSTSFCSGHDPDAVSRMMERLDAILPGSGR
ncbi:hypothetical protein AZH53_07090 [Methanomicrobiaceae archaeon CYW5]|uniref:hypothetical protein n=1 Tax=Methanovulcanius yangii TaxID=1789227 RepID=UPI0029CA1FC4|nr:hypothetical protein [Methanovulcanius yangii]MBT8508168.1 hypothetical protein [Methanovulcanius yangii]